MLQEQPFYIWRCAKCSCHFANITKIDGTIKEEKKCPKCKALNLLMVKNKEIILQCKLYNQIISEYDKCLEEENNNIYI
jgi:phage FluMu protein Com